MNTPFHCPYCDASGLVDVAEAQGARCLVVCEGCAGYCLRYGDEWQPLTHDDLSALAEMHPDVMAGLDDIRLRLVQAWTRGLAIEKPPPTLFAAVMVEMVRTRGPESITWKGRQDGGKTTAH